MVGHVIDIIFGCERVAVNLLGIGGHEDVLARGRNDIVGNAFHLIGVFGIVQIKYHAYGLLGLIGIFDQLAAIRADAGIMFAISQRMGLVDAATKE